MSQCENSKENKSSKSYLSEDKQSKNNENVKSKKITKLKREKEYINKEKYENISYDKKEEQLKLSIDIIKNEKFIVNKYSKLQKKKKKNGYSKMSEIKKAFILLYIYIIYI